MKKVVEELCADSACQRGGAHWHTLDVPTLLKEDDGEYTLTVRVRTVVAKKTQEVTLVTSGRPRYFATTRQLTGLPYLHHAYVYDRTTGKSVASCTHHHGERGGRGQEKAQRCAARMLRRVEMAQLICAR